MLNNLLGGFVTVFMVTGTVAVANVLSSYVLRDGQNLTDVVKRAIGSGKGGMA